MAYITVIEPAAAEGKLAELYQRVRAPNGQVDNVLQIHSLRPHTMEGHMALYKAVLHHSGNRLPKWFLESVGVLVSMLNGCGYCARHHSEGLKRLLKPEPGQFEACLEQLQSTEPGPHRRPFALRGPGQRALVRYSRRRRGAEFSV